MRKTAITRLLFAAAAAVFLISFAGCSSDSGSNDGDRDAADNDDALAEAETAGCDLSGWGRYGAGSKTLTLTDATRNDRQIPVLVVYPTDNRPDWDACEAAYFDESKILRYGEPSICAVADAPPAAGAPFPIIFLSHGSGAMKEGYTYLEEYFASRGFVVVAPDHTGNVGLSNMNPADEEMSYTRLADVKFAMDKTIEAFADKTDQFYNLGDPNRVGMTGHSWGGHTAVIMAGGKYSYEKIKTECDAGTQIDAYQCPLLNRKTDIEAITPDRRIKAVVSWAHDIGKASQPGGPQCAFAAGIKIPWLALFGDLDPYLVMPEDGKDCYDKAGGTACMVLLKGAGHVGFSDMGDEKNMGDKRVLRLARLYSAAFFLRHLNGDASCLETMSLQFSQDGADHDFACR